MAYASRRRTRRTSSRGRPLNRRIPFWVRTIQRNVPHDGTTGLGGIDLLPPADIDRGAVVGSTVQRVRIDWQGNAGALSSLYGDIYFGVALMHIDAVNAISPILELNRWDWMYWRRLSLAQLWRAGAASPSTETAIAFEIDVKSKRRVELPTETLWFVWQWEGTASTPTSTSVVSASVLLRK